MHTNNSIKLNHDDWAAITISNQFKALGIYADFCINDDEGWIQYDKKLATRSPSKINQKAVFNGLLNSWKIENLLRSTFYQFRHTNSGFSMNWAFPQAYFACFQSTLASFSVLGLREKKHTTVQRKMAELASKQKLPRRMNIWVEGGMNDLTVNGIASTCKDFKSASIHPNDFENIKRHLISILISTRRAQLEEKKTCLGIRTKDGKRVKKVLNHGDWEHVSKALGRTSWLCLLNRKRLQTNLNETGTFHSEYFDTTAILVGLIKFTNACNFANEMNVAHQLGIETILKWIPQQFEFASKRIHFMDDLLSQRIDHPEAC